MIYNKKILKAHGFGEKPEFHDYDSMTEFMDAATTETACCAALAMPGTNVNMLFRLGQNLDGIYHDICNFSMTEKEFYEKYSDNVVGDISGAINDAYLQANGTQGSVSYGLVVDLAVAYFHKNIEN